MHRHISSQSATGVTFQEGDAVVLSNEFALRNDHSVFVDSNGDSQRSLALFQEATRYLQPPSCSTKELLSQLVCPHHEEPVLIIKVPCDTLLRIDERNPAAVVDHVEVVTVATWP